MYGRTMAWSVFAAVLASGLSACSGADVVDSAGHPAESKDARSKAVSINLTVDEQLVLAPEGSTLPPATDGDAASTDGGTEVLGDLPGVDGTGSTDGTAATDGGAGGATDGTAAIDGGTGGATDGSGTSDGSKDGTGVSGGGNDSGMATDGGAAESDGGSGATDGASDGASDGDVVVNPSPTPTPAPSAEPQPVEDLNASEKGECAKLLGVPVAKLKVVGNQPNVSVTTDAALAVKVAGNQAKLNLTLSGPAGAHIKGLCLFVTGNQGKANVAIDVGVGLVAYKGRGNLSHSDILVREGALDDLTGDLRGNQASLRLWGPGSHDCGTVSTGGNAGSYVCD